MNSLGMNFRRLVGPLTALTALTALIALMLIVAPAGAQQSGPPATLLNSERIEQRFGSYGIEVVVADGALRVSNLFSEHDGRRITRTFAVVHFADDLPDSAVDAHASIVAGGSIGAVFAAQGWTVARRHLWLGEVQATDHVLGMMMETSGPAELAIHVFALVVSRTDLAPFVYATIAEVHHPDYLSLPDLQRIFDAPSGMPASEHDQAVAAMLERVHAAMQQADGS